MPDCGKLFRYSRQIIFPSIGQKGQKKIAESSVSIVGCGALGCNSANLLARAGVGTLIIIDRDFVEVENLQRQTLFTEEDARECLPKALAAAKHLKEANTEIKIIPQICDFNQRNAETLLSGSDAVVDATDNLESRFLINDVCVKNKIPWIYGAAVGSTGMVKTILPGETACLRCFVQNLPAPGSIPTCETAGILNSVPAIVASLQVSESLKVLLRGESKKPDRKGRESNALIYVDVWNNIFDVIEVKRREGCPTCALGNYEFLDAKITSSVSRLCGHNAVEIIPEHPGNLDLKKLQKRLARLGEAKFNGYLLHFKSAGKELYLFPDARAIVKGTYDFGVAKTIYSKFVGD